MQHDSGEVMAVIDIKTQLEIKDCSLPCYLKSTTHSNYNTIAT